MKHHKNDGKEDKSMYNGNRTKNSMLTKII
jgi:hypothetical protein